MDSIGILYTLRKTPSSSNPQPVLDAEVHVNYWKLPSDKGYSRFLDLGIMVNEKALDVRSIFVYIPFNIEPNDLSDLGQKLKNAEFLCTMLNCDCTISNITQFPSYHLVKFQGNENRHNFWLYELSSDNFSVQNLSDGCLIEIKIKSLPNKSSDLIQKADDNLKRNLYIRFRINNLNDKSFSKIESLSNDFLQSAFSKVEMVDFHINEYRSIKKNILEELNQNNRYFFRFKKVHFYFIGSTEDEEVCGTLPSDQRMHQEGRWSEYLNDVNYSKKIHIAYHWSKKSENNQSFKKFNLFFKIIFHSINKAKVLRYSCYAILLSFIASLLFSLSSSLFVELLNKEDNISSNTSIQQVNNVKVDSISLINESK